MADVEDLLRQVLANQAAGEARAKAMAELLTEARMDARAAREAVAEIKATLGEQNVPERIAELRAEWKAGHVELRSDMVNANARLQQNVVERAKEIDHRIGGVEARVAALEKLRDHAVGARSVLGWMLRHMPWLFAALATFIAGLGWQDKLR